MKKIKTLALVASTAALFGCGAIEEVGDRWFSGKDGKDGKDGAVGQIGPRGPAGAVGAVGQTGARGAAGQNGQDGQDGQDGQSFTRTSQGTVAYGYVPDSDEQLKITESSYNASFIGTVSEDCSLSSYAQTVTYLSVIGAVELKVQYVGSDTSVCFTLDGANKTQDFISLGHGYAGLMAELGEEVTVSDVNYAPELELFRIQQAN